MRRDGSHARKTARPFVIQTGDHRPTESALHSRAAATLTLAAAVLLTTGGISPASAGGPKFKLLYSFPYAENGPYEPLSGLVADKVGNLYGTTFNGPPGAAGTVYKFAPDGTITNLHNFTANGTDGEGPYAGVIFDKAGNLYGTTYGGGTNNSGTVFKLTPDGTETVLHAFNNNGTDGFEPIAGLLERNGNLYGTTALGGHYKDGIVFEIAANGTYTVLHAFEGGNDGVGPWGSLISDTAGNLYGTTTGGGASDTGVVYKIASDGKETVLYAFRGRNDGASPEGALMRDKAGSLYGTTSVGGANGVGTAFRLASDGTETVLYSFKGGNDGAYPQCSVFPDASGNLYGTTYGGDVGTDYGTVFKLAPDGTETVLYAFIGGNDGSYPFFGGLITNGADQKGALFGTAREGGATGGGTIFSIENYKRPAKGI